MKVFQTSLGTPPSLTEGLWFYNGLDCMITLEVLEAIEPQLDAVTRPIYQRALALQGPILEMECRGILVDRSLIAEVGAELLEQRTHVETGLREILTEGVGLSPEEVTWTIRERGALVEKHIWNSPHRLKDFFYVRCGIKPIRKRGAVTVDRGTLEKLRTHFLVQPIVEHILSIRDFNKKLGVLATGIDRDGRMRTSYNIAGTDTGRLSSYSSSFGSGTNLQNITEELRRIFVADPGKKFAYIDLAQVQSRAVGAICWNLFSDGTYLDFCESGDLHTGVCMLTWKDMDWHGTGIEALTNPEWYKHNRALADAPFYRVDSYRQGSKKLGHGTNFLGSPRELSKQTRIPMSLIQQFQLSYFSGFPAIERWHKWLRAKLAKDGFITTATGRRRHFFGRRFEEETVKAAAAYEPQDIEAFLNQTGLLQLWRARLPSVEILIPVHDAILIQYDERREDELIPQILETIKVELPLMNNRSLIVPHDVAVGWNWGKYDKKNSGKNPDGMKDYSGHDERKRSKRVAPMDRKFRPVD